MDRIKLYVVTIAMCALPLVTIPVFGSDLAPLGNQVKSTGIGSVDREEEDKNITNVKVIYNPVVEQINVNFKLGKDSHVVIKLMDALGNEVLGLSNGSLGAGVQSLSFDTDGKVSAGFYFVKLTSDTETIIKRLSVR